MLITFESSKSERVLSLSFHPTRPWILGGLASGKIKIWDYLEKELVFSSRDHKGAVCGVDFHRSKEMFVTGGKDKSIHGWDCQKQRLIFTLLGHKDTINTLQFHKEYPWIVSASNDGTIRIWNWQSRTCVYAWNVSSTPIMCASFAPGGYIVFADSVDHTVRLWDAKALDKGKVSPAVDHPLLMVPDTTTLQGHQDRVNSASSHPSHSSRIVSCANDFTVNSWHISDETKRWELGTLVGHMDHVSSAVFHPTKDDIVVSASKDKSIRVWDTISQTEIHTFCSGGGDRFWSLAAHPEKSLLAAGHDHGLIVFKLERERPAFALSGDSLVFIKDNVLCSYEFSTEAESQLIPLRLPTTLNQSPRTLSYSRKDNAALIFSHLNGGSYELYLIPEDSSGIVREAKRGTGRSAVFVDNSLFAVLEKTTNQVSVRNLNNEVVFTRSLTIPAEAIFYAGTGVLLCSSAVKVVLFDLMRNQVISHLNTPNIVRNIVWSSDQQRLALLSKDTIIIASKKLVLQCTLRETTHVKSGVWDDNNVFIYTTLSHLKCCFPNGKSEIVRYLDTPFYISKVSGNTIFYLDRNGDCLTTTIDAAGCRSVLASRFDMADDGEEYAQGKGWATVDIEDLPSDSEGPPSVIEMEEMSPFPVFQVEGEGEGEGDGWENFYL